MVLFPPSEFPTKSGGQAPRRRRDTGKEGITPHLATPEAEGQSQLLSTCWTSTRLSRLIARLQPSRGIVADFGDPLERRRRINFVPSKKE
jgi:hypothetical protein